MFCYKCGCTEWLYVESSKILLDTTEKNQNGESTIFIKTNCTDPNFACSTYACSSCGHQTIKLDGLDEQELAIPGGLN